MRFLLPLLAAAFIPALAYGQGGCRGTPPAYGSGCYGSSAPRGGCTGFQAGAGCHGTPRASYGCTGGPRTGCHGGGMQMGFPAGPTYAAAPPARWERHESYEGPAGVTLPPPAPRGSMYTDAVRMGVNGDWLPRARERMYADPAAYSAGPPKFAPPRRAGAEVRYGDKVAPGTYATPTGQPPPPEVFGTTGEPHPITNNRFHAAGRALFGKDPGRYRER